jgi:hypothetical protein
MTADKEYLEDIPNIVIEEKGKGRINSQDILVFYGDHQKRMENDDWKIYVINWEQVGEKRLCERVQRNMGELFGAVREGLEAASAVCRLNPKC